MSGVGPWRCMMKQSIAIANLSGRDGDAMPTYGSATTYQCRLVGKRKMVRNARGEEVVSSQHALLASGVMVLPDAKVTLSTSDVGSTEDWALHPPIVATARYPDETGANVYTAVFLR